MRAVLLASLAEHRAQQILVLPFSGCLTTWSRVADCTIVSAVSAKQSISHLARPILCYYRSCFWGWLNSAGSLFLSQPCSFSQAGARDRGILDACCQGWRDAHKLLRLEWRKLGWEWWGSSSFLHGVSPLGLPARWPLGCLFHGGLGEPEPDGSYITILT
jgi:hypothetical protein